MRRLRQALARVTSASDAVEAVALEIQDGFKIKLRFRFTGPIKVFLWALVKTALTQKEPDWNKLFPDGLPVEVDAQIFLQESEEAGGGA